MILKKSPESLEHTRMNDSMIKIVEVLNKFFYRNYYHDSRAYNIECYNKKLRQN